MKDNKQETENNKAVGKRGKRQKFQEMTITHENKT